MFSKKNGVLLFAIDELGISAARKVLLDISKELFERNVPVSSDWGFIPDRTKLDVRDQGSPMFHMYQAASVSSLQEAGLILFRYSNYLESKQKADILISI